MLFRYYVLMFAILVMACPGQEPTLRQRREARLKTVGTALLDYARDHDHVLPAKLSALYAGWYLRDLGAYVAVGSKSVPESSDQIDAVAGFVILAKKAEPADAALVREKKSPDDGPLLVFHADGSITEKGGTPPKKPVVDVPKKPVVGDPPKKPRVDDPPKKPLVEVPKKPRTDAPKTRTEPPPSAPVDLGLKLVAIDEASRRAGITGVLVQKVLDEELQGQDIRKGDILVRVAPLATDDTVEDPKPQVITSLDDVAAVCRRAAAAKAFGLTFRRGETIIMAVLERGVMAEPPTREHGALDALVALLKHQDAVERVAAAREIGTYGQAGLPALQALIATLRDKEPGVRMAAADAIDAIGSEPESARSIPGLVKLLSDESAPVRRSAATALGTVASAASKKERKAALDALRTALDTEKDPRVRQAVHESLVLLGEI